MSPEHYKKLLQFPMDGPWVVKLTNSAGEAIHFKNMVCHRFKELFRSARSSHPRVSSNSAEIDKDATDLEFL